MFAPPRRSQSSLVQRRPPSVHVTAYVTGGLHHLYENVCKKPVRPSQKEKFTDNEGFFAPRPGMPLLAHRYKFLRILGKGQSSILVKVQDVFHNGAIRAVKVLHTQHSQLGVQETDCIRRINLADPYHTSATLRLCTTFSFRGHYCMVFEPLAPEPLTYYFREMSIDKVIVSIRKVALTLLQALGFLEQQNVIHADLKPANILLKTGHELSSLKVVDFGNAIHCIHEELSLYYEDFELQTLLYRAPEVIFGLVFGLEVDLWSLGCVLGELYVNRPLFCGSDKKEMLTNMTDFLGPLPEEVFKRGKFYKELKGFTRPMSDFKAPTTPDLMEKLECNDYAFVDFLRLLLQYNPNERLTVMDAARHPFLAPELGLAYLITPSVSSSYSTVLPDHQNYTKRPFIDEEQKRKRLSSTDLLHEGTSTTPKVSVKVAHVMPVPRARNYTDNINNNGPVDEGLYDSVNEQRTSNCERSKSFVGIPKATVPQSHWTKDNNHNNRYSQSQTQKYPLAHKPHCVVLSQDNEPRVGLIPRPKPCYPWSKEQVVSEISQCQETSKKVRCLEKNVAIQSHKESHPTTQNAFPLHRKHELSNGVKFTYQSEEPRKSSTEPRCHPEGQKIRTEPVIDHGTCHDVVDTHEDKERCQYGSYPPTIESDCSESNSFSDSSFSSERTEVMCSPNKMDSEGYHSPSDCIEDDLDHTVVLVLPSPGSDQDYSIHSHKLKTLQSTTNDNESEPVHPAASCFAPVENGKLSPRESVCMSSQTCRNHFTSTTKVSKSQHDQSRKHSVKTSKLSSDQAITNAYIPTESKQETRLSQKNATQDNRAVQCQVKKEDNSLDGPSGEPARKNKSVTCKYVRKTAKKQRELKTVQQTKQDGDSNGAKLIKSKLYLVEHKSRLFSKEMKAADSDSEVCGSSDSKRNSELQRRKSYLGNELLAKRKVDVGDLKEKSCAISQHTLHGVKANSACKGMESENAVKMGIVQLPVMKHIHVGSSHGGEAGSGMPLSTEQLGQPVRRIADAKSKDTSCRKMKKHPPNSNQPAKCKRGAKEDLEDPFLFQDPSPFVPQKKQRRLCASASRKRSVRRCLIKDVSKKNSTADEVGPQHPPSKKYCSSQRRIKPRTHSATRREFPRTYRRGHSDKRKGPPNDQSRLVTAKARKSHSINVTMSDMQSDDESPTSSSTVDTNHDTQPQTIANRNGLTEMTQKAEGTPHSGRCSPPSGHQTESESDASGEIPVRTSVACKQNRVLHKVKRKTSCSAKRPAKSPTSPEIPQKTPSRKKCTASPKSSLDVSLNNDSLNSVS